MDFVIFKFENIEIFLEELKKHSAMKFLLHLVEINNKIYFIDFTNDDENVLVLIPVYGIFSSVQPLYIVISDTDSYEVLTRKELEDRMEE